VGDLGEEDSSKSIVTTLSLSLGVLLPAKDGHFGGGEENSFGEETEGLGEDKGESLGEALWVFFGVIFDAILCKVFVLLFPSSLSFLASLPPSSSFSFPFSSRREERL